MSESKAKKNSHDSLANNFKYLSAINTDILKFRANLLEKVRIFFKNKGVMEVETPALSHFPAVELHIEPFITEFKGINNSNLYLQSSPEYAMKRLLVSGSGPIFQINHAFRNSEYGPLHNPEFTMLEWYQPDYSFIEIMDEVEELINYILKSKKILRISYLDAFLKYTAIDPHSANAEDIYKKAIELGLTVPYSIKKNKDELLTFLLIEKIEPNLGVESPQILYGYPSSQANLSQIQKKDPYTAERFELYIKGIELCNGYHELLDPKEHLKRFKSENRLRLTHGKSELPIDKLFIDALEHGLPPCSGVALGFDRLVMIAANKQTIDEVLPFPINRA